MSQVESGLRSLLRYSSVYSSFQSLLAHKDSRRRYVDEHIRPQAGMRILDLGCGPADILHYYPEGLVYVGIDANLMYLETAKAKFGNRGHFLQGDFNLPQQLGEKFDVITALGLIHHLDDPASLRLLEAARLSLKPDGFVFTIDPVFCKEVGAMGRWIISRDRGQNVRWRDEYLSLGKQVFSHVEHEVRTDLMRIPYAHMIMKMYARKPSQ